MAKDFLLGFCIRFRQCFYNQYVSILHTCFKKNAGSVSLTLLLHILQE